MNNKIIYIDIDSKEYKEFIFDKEKVSGIKMIGNKSFNISYDDLFLLWDIFYPKKPMIKIDTYLDYDVYYDEDNNLKHYYKNDEEDYSLFLEKNGSLAYDYLKLDKEQKEKYKIRFKKGMIVLDILGLLLCLNLSGKYYYESKLDQVSDIISIVSIDELSYSLDINDMKEYIYSSPGLTHDQKMYLYNEDLFNKLLPYYQGTSMERIINNRLNGLSISFFAPEERPKDSGYYKGDNTIYIKQGRTDAALSHEMIHLLESTFCHQMFFRETMADIVAKEYYSLANEGYPAQDYNLKLLINTIGFEPIWDYVFGGDYSKIDEIFKNNLNEKDYLRINEVLESSVFTDDLDKELESLIKTLYKNIYKENIEDNKDIFDISGNLIDQVYFNDNKIKPYNEYIALNKDILNDTFVIKKAPLINISKEDAERLKQEGYSIKTTFIPSSDSIKIKYYVGTPEKMESIVFDYKEREVKLTFEEALEYGYFTIGYQLIVDEKAMEMVDYEIPDTCSFFTYNEIEGYNYQILASDYDIKYIFITKTIKDRFPNQEILNNKNIEVIKL